jgi:hypothetical protein
MSGGGFRVYIATLMRTRNRGRGGASWIARGPALATVVGWMLLAPSAAAAQEYATPDPDSPAGEEYALPIDQARADAVGDSRRRGSGPPSAGGSDTRGAAPLFGAGIAASAGGGGGGGDGDGEGGGDGGRGEGSGSSAGGRPDKAETMPASAPEPTHAVVERASTDRQVALVVFFVLLGAAAFACLIRFVAGRGEER